MTKKAVRPMGMVRCNSSVPFASPFAERYSRQEENRKLVCAIKHMKASVDNTPPRQCPHLQDNKKKELLIEQRYAKIERENAILLDRLCLIARPRCTTVKPKPIMPGIALDVHLRPVIDNQETDARLPVRSLNAVIRKQELIRVMHDNQTILERICKSKGVYSADKWRQDGEQQQKYAAMRRRYLMPLPSQASASGGNQLVTETPAEEGAQ
ncbi:hypothetical protein WJX72_006210 [[Myrmecia] bisecta]|uniref:Uncharacterized protein n=1 Tax=[Myrmecia] bisecta TaxID=41462 RepID=A0AAW1R798_9CHLO